MKNFGYILITFIVFISCINQNPKVGNWIIINATNNGRIINHKGSLIINEDGQYWFTINTNGEANFVNGKTNYSGKGEEYPINWRNSFTVIVNPADLSGIYFKLISVDDNIIKLKSDVVGWDIEYTFKKDK